MFTENKTKSNKNFVILEKNELQNELQKQKCFFNEIDFITLQKLLNLQDSAYKHYNLLNSLKKFT